MPLIGNATYYSVIDSPQLYRKPWKRVRVSQNRRTGQAIRKPSVYYPTALCNVKKQLLIEIHVLQKSSATPKILETECCGPLAPFYRNSIDIAVCVHR